MADINYNEQIGASVAAGITYSHEMQYVPTSGSVNLYYRSGALASVIQFAPRTPDVRTIQESNWSGTITYDGNKTLVVSNDSTSAAAVELIQVNYASDGDTPTPTTGTGMQIITGRTGVQHVYATDDAQIYRCFLGSGDYVLHDGQELDAVMTGATELTVFDGAVMMQGRLAKIRPSDGSQVLTFENGVSGYKRCDLVVAEYRNSAEIESINLKVIKGTNDSEVYVEPVPTTGIIDNGEVHQFLLYAVHFDGLNFDELIDRRTFLTDAPINPLTDLINATRAQMLSEISTLAADTQRYCNQIKDDAAAKLSGHNKFASTNWQAVGDSAAAEVVITGAGTAGDVKTTDFFFVFLNGRKLTASEYSVAVNSADTTITFSNITGQPDSSNVVELEVLR